MSVKSRASLLHIKVPVLHVKRRGFPCCLQDCLWEDRVALVYVGIPDCYFEDWSRYESFEKRRVRIFIMASIRKSAVSIALMLSLGGACRLFWLWIDIWIQFRDFCRFCRNYCGGNFWSNQWISFRSTRY